MMGMETTTLSLPQDIHTGASPTFSDLTLSSPSSIYSLNHDSFSGAGTLDTEAEIEPAIDTLANLTSVQGQSISLSGSLTVESASVLNQDTTTDAAPRFDGGIKINDTSVNIYRDTDGNISFTDNYNGEGTGNTLMGEDAGASIGTGGNYNVAIGYEGFKGCSQQQ